MSKPVIAAVGLVFFMMDTVTFAGTLVDQGRPGNQGPWSVTCSNCGSSGSSDGGTSTVGTQPVICRSSMPDGGSAQNVQLLVANTAAPVPPLPQGSRVYINVCLPVGTVNPSTAVTKCATGTTPTLAAVSPGDLLSYGDCVTYAANSSNVIQCISDAGYYVTAFECVPQ